MKKLLIFCGTLLFCSCLFAKHVVVTSIQPVYAIAKELTKGTSIDVQSVFSSGVSMDMAREAMKGEDFIEPKGKVDAVIDVSRVWIDDNLYSHMRQKNIRTVEIDASQAFGDDQSTLFFLYGEDGKPIPYVWMGNKNLIKMASIISGDLTSLYPKERKKLEKNLVKFYEKSLKLEESGNLAFLNCNATEVLCLSPNVQYFLNDFNIYSEAIDPKEVTVESAAKIMEDTGIRVFVSDRWLKKKVIKAIRAAGGDFVVLNTLNIPIDKEEAMDEEAIWKSYEANINALTKALQK